jgi:hypothetical protein
MLSVTVPGNFPRNDMVFRLGDATDATSPKHADPRLAKIEAGMKPQVPLRADANAVYDIAQDF